MPKQLTLCILLLIIACQTQAQSLGCTGMVQDSINVKSIPYASISMIRQSDSILVAHTRSSQQGKFTFTNCKAGKYILLIAHASFVDFVDDIELKEGDGIKNIGSYNLFQRGQLLREVVIKNSSNIKIKGDTLEYLADSFHVRQGAVVEDLLKVLPGIQVNKKGEITAMGEKVQKVLVDGEEFFGDDPTVATQNIQSKVVEKVQVFDKKSDQAQFTGFDDGQEEKTINLKLKKNMNRGEFGKVELGGGWEDRWQNQAMINSFKNKRQMSLYGIMSSNGKTGLGWQDRNKYTGDNAGMQMDEDGGFMWNMSEDDDNAMSWGGNSIPEGITKAWTGGAHFANKWNEGKYSLNTNYSFGRINKTKSERSSTENLLPGRSYLTEDTSTTFSSMNTHRITSRFECQLDSSLTLIYNLNSRIGFNTDENNNSTKNITYSDLPINSSKRNNSSESKTIRVSNQMTFNKKYKKIGRTLSLSNNFVYNNNHATGYLEGNNSYENTSNPILEILDQKKDQNQITNTISSDIAYTEPLSKKWLLKLSYGISSDNSESQKAALVKPSNDDNYRLQIDSLSSEFSSHVFSQTVGSEIKYTAKKYNVAMGTKARYSTFTQEDLVRNINYNYNRINLFPTLRFNYKFDQFNRFTFTYTGSTKQPSVKQMQPIQDNSNPLELYIGNPNLKVGYTQNFNINYFNYKVLTSRSLYAGLSFTNLFNNISLNRTFDNLGRTINQYVNLNGAYNSYFYSGLNTKIHNSSWEPKIALNGNLNHTPNIINNKDGVTNSYAITFSPGIAYNKEDKISFNIDLGTIYNTSKSTFSNARNISYISYNPSTSVTYYFPKSIEVGTDADFQYAPPVAPYNSSFHRFLWNAYLGYKMLPSKTLEWKLSMNDILNQNKGYERTTSDNFNKERNFKTLGRYWMLSAVWNFNSGPMAGPDKKGTGPRMKGGMRRGGGMRGRM